MDDGSLNRAKVMEVTTRTLIKFLGSFISDIKGSIEGLDKEDLTKLTAVYRKFKPIHKESAMLRGIANGSLDKIGEDELDAAHFYILASEYVHEIAGNVDLILKSILDYVDNNHKPFLDVQIEELLVIHEGLNEMLEATILVHKNDDQPGAIALLNKMDDFVTLIRSTRKNQIKRIKNGEIGTRNSLLYLSLLGELRNVGWFTSRIVKAYMDLADGNIDTKTKDSAEEKKT